MSQPTTIFVGLDVHKDSISVAYAARGQDGPAQFVGPIGTRQSDIEKMAGVTVSSIDVYVKKVVPPHTHTAEE